MAHFPGSRTLGASERGPVPEADARDAGMLRAARNELGAGGGANPSLALPCRTRRHMEASRRPAQRVLLYGRTACDLNCGAVRGTTIQRTSARRTATGINLTTGTT